MQALVIDNCYLFYIYLYIFYTLVVFIYKHTIYIYNNEIIWKCQKDFCHILYMSAFLCWMLLWSWQEMAGMIRQNALKTKNLRTLYCHNIEKNTYFSSKVFNQNVKRLRKRAPIASLSNSRNMSKYLYLKMNVSNR